jgi:hypothetical protein
MCRDTPAYTQTKEVRHMTYAKPELNPMVAHKVILGDTVKADFDSLIDVPDYTEQNPW